MADRQQAEQTKAAADAVIEYLRPLVQEHSCRLVRTFKRHEVEGVAVAAITAYVAVRKRQEDKELLQEMLDDEPNRLSILLA